MLLLVLSGEKKMKSGHNSHKNEKDHETKLTHLFSGLEGVSLEKLRKKKPKNTAEWLGHQSKCHCKASVELQEWVGKSHITVIRSLLQMQDTKVKKGFIIWVWAFRKQTAFDHLKQTLGEFSQSLPVLLKPLIPLHHPQRVRTQKFPVILKKAACRSSVQ